jgi:ribosome biogenesis protein NSA1
MRLTPLTNEGDQLCPLLSSLPTRLHDWRLSSNQETFAYGGEEVDLSVWNTETAFLPRPGVEGPISRKRKRNDALMPGEIWRAKNVFLLPKCISFVGYLMTE